MSSVEQQQHEMTSRGLLNVCSRSEDEEPEGRLELSTRELQQLSHRVQLWPLMEQLAVLNQLRLSNNLLHLAFSPGYSLRFKNAARLHFQYFYVFPASMFGLIHSDQKAEESLRRELSRHLRYCLQSTPVNLSHLQPLWFLLSSEKVSEIKVYLKSSSSHQHTPYYYVFFHTFFRVWLVCKLYSVATYLY